jgi:bacillithiol biosynthesis deacetylase BshB1
VPHEVVVFGAHPDDAEMGMGGTIAKLCRAGRSLLIVSLTRGERGTHGDGATRVREAAAAAAILECETRILDLPDTRLENDLETRDIVMRLVREERPRLVFAPYHTNLQGHRDGAGHADHRVTGALVRDALRIARLGGVEPALGAHDVGRLLYYMVPRDRQPHVVVDVTDAMETLERALQAYKSQMRIERAGNPILEVLWTFRRSYGIAAGCRYAEAFLAEEPVRADAATLFTL